MAKDWITIKTVNSVDTPPKTKAENFKRERTYEKIMKTTKSLSVADLKKHSIELYNKKIEEEDKLLQAFEDKRLKSEKAIKQAIRIKKEREKRKKEDTKQDVEKISEVSETTEITENPV